MTKFLITVLLILAGNTLANAQVAVIANRSVPVNSIDKTDLTDIYTRDIRFWEDKSPVILFDLKPRTEVKKIFYDYLGKSSSRMKSIWMKKKLSGEGDPPRTLLTEENILANVASTPGSIGYISASKINNSVKVLAILSNDKK